jgi:hypothetical protein
VVVFTKENFPTSVLCFLALIFQLWSSLLGDNIDAIKKNMETLFDDSKEVGLEVNTEKIKYMLLSRHQNAGQSYDIKIATKCFENMAKFGFRRKLRGD